MNAKHYKNYLMDLIPILIENSKALIAEHQKNPNDFTDGQIFAYYDVLSVMQQQAIAFGLDTTQLGLEQLEVEKFVFSES